MLEDIHVVDLGTVITAPLAGVMLADLGAQVIKVERPEGDPFRRAWGGSYSPNFLSYNRGKRSIVLNLTIERDLQDLLQLIDRADVLLDNFRPGVLGRLGLDPAMLRTRNPRLIHCSITGYGTSGPYSTRPAFDGVGQALSGISSLFLDPDDPAVTGPTITDNITGMYAAYAVLGALHARERSGTGRRLEINMLEASMAFIQDAFVNFLHMGLVGNPSTRVATSQSFAVRCADGKLLALHLSTQEKFWLSLLAAIGASDLASDPRFATHLDRVKAYAALQSELTARFAKRSRADWVAVLKASDVPFGPIYEINEVLEDPQVRTMDILWAAEHPTEGTVRTVHCPVMADGQRVHGSRSAPPTLGEHTLEIRAALKSIP